jgi:curved DNA-binding protein CbpA
MVPQKTHYEILGLPKTASTAEIKKRYRELARKYHPDVARDKASAAKTFVAITESYRTLLDPEKRRAYDATLIDVTTAASPPKSSSRPSTPPGMQSTSANLHPDISKLLKDAEIAFIRKRLDQAKNLCKQAIKIDKSCARAHAILGDIHRAKHQHEMAINEYTYAIQFNPSDKDSAKKLNQLLEQSSPVNFSWEAPDGRMSNVAIALNTIGWSMAIFILFLINIYPGKPISWLGYYHLSIIKSWSWNLIGLMFGDGILVGFLMGINRLIEHPDDELIFDMGGRGWSIIPTGLILLLFGPVFFVGSASFYIVFGLIQDAISKSIVFIILTTVIIAALSALLFPIDKISVLLFGGNVAFVGALIGWYFGSIFAPDR